MSKKKPSPSTIAVNRKARHLYELSDFMEAGISLTGPEVKSVRAGKVNFIDSYVDFRNGQALLLSLHIAPYANAGYAPQAEAYARAVPLSGGLRLSAAVTRARQMVASNVSFAAAFESILLNLTEEYTQWPW